ncbi:hypothetical protein SEA_BONAEVITAE_2 [Microbacterium phage BonaeVitae]|uniref:Uncharacterized protein n=1 Tax=Microbacterium phage BonaeVitae TaxID=2126925 RepID=A0A2R3ZZP5_9CAUD|nr:hypothetical protein JTF59_gp02 [Microbacterium phage BonaeVitae]AVR56152.1 hypothetical protein SEA_BONAEVITAE_2 [Microbacterium phage BonaeVitae]
MTRQTTAEAFAQLQLALDQLGRQLQLVAAEWLRSIERAADAGRQLLRAGLRAGEILRRRHDLSCAGALPDAQQLPAGYADATSWLPAPSRFDAAMAAITAAGPELLPWQRDLLAAAARGDLAAPARMDMP